MNPFKVLPKSNEIAYEKQTALSLSPYDKLAASPYTKTRIILLSGAEFEANWFLHQFNRHCLNNDVRRILAAVRRDEQQQQKALSSLKPLDENILETTIAYDQLAVDLTAEMAEKEKNLFVKAQLNFALLEDFDHLYRYSDLLDMENGFNGYDYTGGYTEITPGRPTVAEPRHPDDDVRRYINFWQDDLLTILHTGIITAAEQQTMNYYMNVGNTYPTDEGRKLYSEIAMIEEQHVTGYGALCDPSLCWFESWVVHEYTECYLYYSAYEDETDARLKKLWLKNYEKELVHLKIAAETMQKYNGRAWEQLFKGGADFPSLIKLRPHKEYIRNVLKSIRLTGYKEDLVKITELPDDYGFFKYQDEVVTPDGAATHNVIERYIKEKGKDYRTEDAPHPDKLLRDRKKDNTTLGRVKTPE